MRSVFIVVSVIVLTSCGNYAQNKNIVIGSLCQSASERDARLKRFSYDMAPIFRGAKCSGVELVHNAPVDGLAISTERSFQGGGLYARSAAVRFSIEGNLAGNRLEYFLPPEEFVRFHEDSTRYRGYHRLTSTQWVRKAGGKCVRFEYFFMNSMRKMQEVEYWCWEDVSTLPVPFRVSAVEVVGSHESWSINLDEEILDYFFAGLQIKPVSSEVVESVKKERLQACLRHKEYFDRNGRGWTAGDFPDHRRALRLLKSCGYDVEVPPHDGRVLEPNLNNLYR